MVKLASARESRLYAPHPVRNRWEYINAGIHVFAAALLFAGFSAQLPSRGDNVAGLVFILVASALFALVNAHDLVAHMAGIDYRLSLVAYDLQLAFVELAVPFFQMLGSILTFTAILFVLIQEEKRYDYRTEKHAVNMLIAGPLLWTIGSIGNACQIYERADGDTQILQSSVSLPFLMGSLLFFVAGICNRQAVLASTHHEALILGRSWAWLCAFGSLLMMMGGLMNVVKVFRTQQRSDRLRLEKLRGGAQERLFRDREGRVPILEDSSRARRRLQQSDSQVLTSASSI